MFVLGMTEEVVSLAALPCSKKHGLVPQMEEAGTPYVAEEVTASSEDFRLHFLFIQVVGDSSRASQ